MAPNGCCQGQDWCAVTCTGQIIGRKWHTIIIHRLLRRGPQGFSDLLHAIEGLSTKVLSESLDDLMANGILSRTVVNDQPVRVEYDLTQAGRDFGPVIDAMEAWGRRHLDASGTLRAAQSTAA